MYVYQFPWTAIMAIKIEQKRAIGVEAANKPALPFHLTTVKKGSKAGLYKYDRLVRGTQSDSHGGFV